MSTKKLLVAALLLSAVVCLGDGGAFKAGSLEVQQPWARATVAGAQIGAVYFKVQNAGKVADTLLSAENPAVAERMEIHSHSNDKGVMRMREVKAVPVPAAGSVALQPGGYHLMLINLKAPLKEGQRLPLTLHFAKAGELKVEVSVESVAAEAASK